jgi:hypothetical protein
VVPLFDADGEIVSLHARSVRMGEMPAGVPKGVSPTGHEIRGLVLADGLARQVLRTGLPDWWTAEDPFRVLVVEGVPDFLAASLAGREDVADAPAIIGVLSGSWSKALAARVPTGAILIVATHDDEAGEHYAECIRSTFDSRCSVYRAKPVAFERGLR